MSAPTPVEATEQATALAAVAHGGVQHGDNDPEATRALVIDRAVVDRMVPPVQTRRGDRPMCAGWTDHREQEVT